MNKNAIKKSLFFGSVVASVAAAAIAGILAVPLFSLADVTSSLATPPVNPAPSVACYPFAHSLSVGASGNDVAALQNYLKMQGYFSPTVTGYFGVITKAAVGRWQAQNNIVAIGNAGNGMFGPLSRGVFIKLCSGGGGNGGGNGNAGSGQGGGSGGNNSSTPMTESFSANPQSGSAPLTVQFIASAPQGSTLGKAVDFGDGTTGNLGVVPVCSICNAEGIVSHTYTATGTYTAMLTSGTCSCPANGICNCPNIQILATATVVVAPANTGTTTTSSSSVSIQQLNSSGSVTLSTGDIAEIRNYNSYFTLRSIASSSATIQVTPVGCWNSFPSDPRPKIVCMIALVPIPPRTLAIGQAYTAGNYSIMLTQLTSSTATFAIE
jgi:peptidoglycan hydrolase-like protein with peptidoglycan-binding domain